MGCVNGYINAIGNGSSCSFTAALGAYDTRNSKFTAYNGSVAGHSAAVGYNGFGFLHSRYPVRSGHFGYEDFAFLELVDMGRVEDNVSTAGYKARACGQAFNDNLAVGGCCFCFNFRFVFFIAAAPYGFGACLENPDFAVAGINAPFHIHIAAIMCFNFFSVACKFKNLFVGKGLNIAFCFRYGQFFAVAAFFAHKHNVLLVYAAVNNFVFCFGNGVIIRGNGTLYNIFAKAESSFNKDVAVIAGSNVNGEHNAGGFAEYHHLNNCAESYFDMVEALFFTVVYGAVGKAGSITFLNFGNDVFCAFYVKVSILLACKAGIRQVFCGSAAAYCNIRFSFAHFFAQFFISCGNGCF